MWSKLRMRNEKSSQISEELHRMANFFRVMQEIRVAKSISGDKYATECRMHLLRMRRHYRHV